MRALATSADTDGAFELVEDQRDVGEGPAPHIHHRSDEAFYIVEGSFQFTRGGEEIDAGPRSYVLVARGTPHGYRATAAGSRLLILYFPAGAFCDYLREVDANMERGMTSAAAMFAIRERYDTTPV